MRNLLWWFSILTQIAIECEIGFISNRWNLLMYYNRNGAWKSRPNASYPFSSLNSSSAGHKTVKLITSVNVEKTIYGSAFVPKYSQSFRCLYLRSASDIRYTHSLRHTCQSQSFVFRSVAITNQHKSKQSPSRHQNAYINRSRLSRCQHIQHVSEYVRPMHFI